ncbi:MAG: DUF4338 domain-containing protein [Planctomycetes bacterium]|nr:DUF4338 domain-containing protein [Planctomycetota bacterium]
MTSATDTAVRYCGRLFTGKEIGRIRQLITSDRKLNRAQLSRIVCDEFNWLRPDGRSKEMSCRVAMLRMERDGLITLPPPQKGTGNGKTRPRLTSISEPQEAVSLPAGALGKLLFRPVNTPDDSKLWNELIERYHYLGYKPLPGAQIRYLVFGNSHLLLAALGFGAAAWTVAPRDRFIGWTAQQRKHNLHLVVNNARFLILPWVTSHNLASRILAGIARQLPHDWQERYNYKPTLLETFVEQKRFRGTCYRAANWTHVGQTQGRGKLDRQNRYSLPVKDIFLYPLDKHFRQTLHCQA